MPTRKYLLILRRAPGGKQETPSPAQMQEMFDRFNAWKEKFKDNIVDMGGKLGSGGRIVTTSGVTDGPFVETKEVVGGYMVVAADTYDRAIEIAREGPGMVMAGTSIEIREMVSP